mgnify:CR=1 FL=1
MLAKLWKKVLLAVCIVACIFNIMTKLVNRNSLEVNLKSANDGNTVFDFTRKEKESEGPGFIEELQQVLNEEQNNTKTQNVVSQEVVPEDSNSKVENENDTQNEVENNTENNVENKDNVIKAEVSGEKKTDSSENNGTVQYKDAFTTFVELF